MIKTIIVTVQDDDAELRFWEALQNGVDMKGIIVQGTEDALPSPNKLKAVICSNNPCEYCKLRPCEYNSCDDYDMFEGRKLTAI